MEETRQISAAEAKRLYQRQWRRQNPERVKAIQERYWQRKAAQYAEMGNNPGPEKEGG